MNLPIDFEVITRSLLGEKKCEQLFEALQQEAPTSIRRNPRKGQKLLSPEGDAVPWTTRAVYLKERPTFTFDPLFHAGCYYVQEAASMFVEQAVRDYAAGASMALDLCAAPGGKSTLLRDVLPPDCLLVANEFIRNRAQVLAENVTKWGDPNTVVTNNAPADFGALGACFDVMLTDVPCSGEGMFRKDPVAVQEWSVENVEVCRQRQRDILIDVWPALRQGGLLIYSTCTYNTKENEENVDWICSELGAEALPLALEEEWGVTGNLLFGSTNPVYRFLPHLTRGEGFFLAVLRKTSDAEQEPLSARRKNSKKGMKEKTQPLPAEIKEWLTHPDDYRITVESDKVVAFPKQHVERMDKLRESLNALCCGLLVGELKGRDCIPAHALAMSTALSSKAFPFVELTYEQSISYLRKEAVVLNEAPRGYVLLTYCAVPLGFAKNVGNRANNLYPTEWRIRSGYLPEEIKVVLGNGSLNP